MRPPLHPSSIVHRGRVHMLAICAAALSCCPGFGRQAQDAARTVGEPLIEPPTLRCLGFQWRIAGDENRNARIALFYRPAGSSAWKEGYPLVRVSPVARPPGAGPATPPGVSLFAGSLALLEPGTQYEVRLALSDPDGGSADRRLTARTLAEPSVKPLRTFHVAPGRGGGTGAAADPFLGLPAAISVARPADLFLLRAGSYPAPFRPAVSGEPGRPVIWRGTGDGRAIVEPGRPQDPPRMPRGVDAADLHDVWFEDLTIRNATYGVVANRSSRIVVRRCHIRGAEYGIALTNNDRGTATGLFLSDNVIEGPSTWPRTIGIESARGIQVTGSGHVVCYNRIRGFADGIDTFPSRECAAIDFHNNDVHEMTDDGIEMDFSERNTRCFQNRLTNVFQGISTQPVYGGPVYVFRNVMVNVSVESFKMHNSPSGALFFHNTSVKRGAPLVLWTSAPIRGCVTRNNLFIGTPGPFAYDCRAPMVDCAFDYDGFGGGPWTNFLRWNGIHYASPQEVRARAPVYRHAVEVDATAIFASGLRPPEDPARVFDRTRVDVRLRAESAAIDSGAGLPGFSDGYSGRGPDLGALEFGSEPPHYGPRPVRRQIGR